MWHILLWGSSAGDTIAGQTLTCEATLVPGALSGASTIPGQLVGVNVSLIPGAMGVSASIASQVISYTYGLLAGSLSGSGGSGGANSIMGWFLRRRGRR